MIRLLAINSNDVGVLPYIFDAIADDRAHGTQRAQGLVDSQRQCTVEIRLRAQGNLGARILEPVTDFRHDHRDRIGIAVDPFIEAVKGFVVVGNVQLAGTTGGHAATQHNVSEKAAAQFAYLALGKRCNRWMDQ